MQKHGHQWDGCICTRCGQVRDEKHDFEKTTITKLYDENGCEIDHEIKPWDDLYGASITYQSAAIRICSKCGKVEALDDGALQSPAL